MPRREAPALSRGNPRGPIVGLTTSYEAKDERLILKYSYVQSVLKAGGRPLVLPPVPKNLIAAQLDWIDGLIFIGGPDYCPARYGQKAGKHINLMDPLREDYDFDLFQAARQRRIPSLYVCGGLQLAAINFGCQLIQDIGSQWQKPLVHQGGTRHKIELTPGSQLARIAGRATMTVNSYHHQAIDPQSVPAGLQVTARAPDGVVEAFEVEPGGKFDNGALFIAVQWHPERINTQPEQLKIFKRLIAAAHAAGKKRRR